MKQLKLFVNEEPSELQEEMNQWINAHSANQILTVKIATRENDILGIIIYEDYNNTKRHEKILFQD